MSNASRFWLFMVHYLLFGVFSIGILFDSIFLPTALIFAVNTIILNTNYEIQKRYE